MTRPLYIFDLDGTLALIDHRRHLVNTPPCPECNGVGFVPGADDACSLCKGMKRDPRVKPDWAAFNAACVDDLPNEPIIDIMNNLWACGADIRIWSGRSDDVELQTVNWIEKHTQTPASKVMKILTMRETGDFTEDALLKLRWLGLMYPHDRSRLQAVFDDRDSVVKMWRDNGITCLQVAPGSF